MSRRPYVPPWKVVFCRDKINVHGGRIKRPDLGSSGVPLPTFKAIAKVVRPLCVTGWVVAISVVGVASGSGAPVENHHLSVDSSVYPWSSLAKLFNSVGGSCTGAVIGPTSVLTAAHCVYAFRTHRFLPAEALHVLLGYARGDYATHARVVGYRLGPGYDPEAERKTAASDWVVLELAKPLPATVQPLHLEAAPAAPGDRVMLTGFARDRAFVMTADEDCSVTGRVDPGQLVAHDCDIQPGDSGAPLLRRRGATGEVDIVGIAVGIWHTQTGTIGIAAPVPTDLATAPR